MINEMGNTMRAVIFTRQLVPNDYDFQWGTTYLYSIFSVFPNLFWDIHPSQSHHLGAWLTKIVAPEYYKIGGGLGYSFIAEAYINFGWIGVTFLNILFGYLYAMFCLWAQKQNDIAKIATVACFLIIFPMFARGESLTIMRPLIWYSFIPYLTVRVLGKKGCFHFHKNTT